MKKLGTGWIVFLVLAAMLCGCAMGNVSHVNMVIGASEHFEEREIEAAMDTVIRYFRGHFDGCTLTRLAYDELETEDAAAEWAEQYEADEAIVLISDFDVGASGGDGSLNPNSTYPDWRWILTRSNGGGWELQTWGYG